MTQKSRTIEVLDDYFTEKGSILKAQEYKRESDTPIRYQLIRNIFGSWPRMEKIMMARREVKVTTDANEVAAASYAAEAVAEAAAKAAGEDQAAKAAKIVAEQAAEQVIAEAAVTPETMNALKVASNVVEVPKATAAKPVKPEETK